MSKAERLEALTAPYGPDFPLDRDIVAELEPYPGELPRTFRHYLSLLPDVQPAQ